jgi:hypothetical protein
MPEPRMRDVIAAYVPQALTLLAIAAVIVTLAVAIVRSAPGHPVTTAPAVAPCQDPGSGSPGNPFTGSDEEHDPAGCDPTADPAEVYAPPGGASDGDIYRDNRGNYDPGYSVPEAP